MASLNDRLCAAARQARPEPAGGVGDRVVSAGAGIGLGLLLGAVSVLYFFGGLW